MGYKDVNRKVLLEVIGQMPESFATKDVSEHSLMLRAHPELINHSQYHAFVGKALKNLTEGNGRNVLRELRAGTSRGSVWALTANHPVKDVLLKNFVQPSSVRQSRSSNATLEGKVVRPGHYQTLKYMSSMEFMAIRARFTAVPEFGGVYFRPLDSGVRMVDLHARSPKPRIGIGEGTQSLLKRGTTLAMIESSIPDRIAYLKDVRARQVSASQENQLEAGLIREAQKHHLIMPGFPDRLRFIHSQWRIDRPGGNGQQFTDLLAVDLKSRTLVLIELKREKDLSALPQVQGYLNYFQENADELNPFFTELARLMGELYDCPELASIGQVATAQAALAAWPGWLGLKVEGLADLERLREAPVKTSATRYRPDPAPPVINDTVSDNHDIMGIGPQYKGDNAFTARMRLHQSRYRAETLKVPFGKGPTLNSHNYYGNMLSTQAAAAGANFLTPDIFEVVKARLAESSGAVEAYRLLHNMLSSQPMCFNLFGPMVNDTKLATKLLQTILPDEIKHVRRVLIEYAPEPKGEYLNDRTAFDAFIEYERTNGRLAFIGIETKLTEPFSQKHYDSPAYRRWMRADPNIFKSDAEDKVDDIAHNQLWRDHLLVIAMQAHPESLYETGTFMLVRHPEDDECARITAGYSSLLQQKKAGFNDVPLDLLVDKFERAELTGPQSEWLKKFRLRYLNLEAGQ